MTEIIGVRFQRSGKIYYFDPAGYKFNKNQGVIVETSRGVEYGTVTIDNLELPDDMIPQEPKAIVRIANEDDEVVLKENEALAKEAFDICNEKVLEHMLDMKLVEAEYTFDRNKLIFYFISDNRVDFRILVRDLAQIFKTRIELRQIGVRDQAKMIGGIGSCGQEICCHRYMSDFSSVSIKMAKTQGLSLNPTKISGVCGRLMCCLNYEQEVYLEHSKQLPSEGTLVLTEDGQGHVVDRDVLQKRVRVHVYKEDGTEEEKYYKVDDVEILQQRRKGQQKPTLWEHMEEHIFVTEGEKNLVHEDIALDMPDKCSSCQSPIDGAEVVAEAVSAEYLKHSFAGSFDADGEIGPKSVGAFYDEISTDEDSVAGVSVDEILIGGDSVDEVFVEKEEIKKIDNDYFRKEEDGSWSKIYDLDEGLRKKLDKIADNTEDNSALSNNSGKKFRRKRRRPKSNNYQKNANGKTPRKPFRRAKKKN